MSRWKKEEQKKNPSHDPIFQEAEVASATECTGLMPAQIQGQQQGEDLAALQAIHPILPPDEAKNKGKMKE